MAKGVLKRGTCLDGYTVKLDQGFFVLDAVNVWDIVVVEQFIPQMCSILLQDHHFLGL